MDKRKEFDGIKFSPRIIRAALEKCRSLAQQKEETVSDCTVGIGKEKWTFDELEEFFAAYSGETVDHADLGFWWHGADMLFDVSLWWNKSIIKVRSKSRSNIESVFSIFEESSPADRTDVSEKTEETDRTIFIGHGRNKAWQQLKSHLQDKHALDVIAYETGARAGHTIRDILDSMAEDSALALLVLTGEDKTSKGRTRARQNVIHECGLFQGRLGFDRAIMLVEQGIELGSNFDGVQQIRFKKGRISETFGDVLATIRREFGEI